MRHLRFFLIIVLFLTSCGPLSDTFDDTPVPAIPTKAASKTDGPNLQIFPDAYSAKESLGRGLNLGDALEAPRDGQWGVVIVKQYFELIKKAGFNSVRIPINWEAHAWKNAPYTIDWRFFARVDQVVGWALKQNLVVILDFHSYPDLMENPQGHQKRYLALWQQIAGYYKNYPKTVLFELLNEPNGKLDSAQWNKISNLALTLVRQTNPNRNVIIGGASSNSYDQLQSLELPAKDRHIILTFHYYNPFEFTHQGADWVDMDKFLGQTWDASFAEKATISGQFFQVATWSLTQNRPVLVGEFGAYSKADMDSRARWTSFVAGEAEKHGFAWSYWEFGSKFGVYDRTAKAWREPLLKALIP
ncbi:MAG: glycoside hydrolase family 5 protein [Chloroflexota bacterium]